MAISYTYHGTKYRNGSYGPAQANATAVSDGAASSALSKSGYYRIVATSSSLLQTGPAVTNGASGEVWPSGRIEYRWVEGGDKLGCSAGA